MKDVSTVDPAIEQEVGITVALLADLFVLDAIKGFGPQKFKELYESGLSPTEVIERPERLPIRGKRGDQFRNELRVHRNKLKEECLGRAVRQLNAAQKNSARIITYSNPAYPKNVYQSNNPIPLLFVRGSLDVLASPQSVACVGTRGIREPYDKRLKAFAEYAVERQFTVVSGFAIGADTIAHKAAFGRGGRTIAVMPCGLDRTFPPENKGFWKDLLQYPKATFVTEFAFGTSAKSLTLRKRNKLIVAFALGVLIAQSSATGGAMNAYRFALEQKKPISTFVHDGCKDSTGNELIANAVDSQPTTFSNSVGQDEDFDVWLEKLCSST